ncbi:DUF427 domain-containing protein [Amphritea sp. HPY]|uniref:DUF427 domain-containing protein n=1 Tax=Amphritea sp. HPY TaxID=3421652 RepID=UPI003D7D6BCA
MAAPGEYSAYQVSFEPSKSRIRVEFNGRTIADSQSVMILLETGLPAIYYFPRDDIYMEHLTRTDHRTHCPFKGNANYWTVNVAGKRLENAAWSYEDPQDEAEAVRNYIAFDWDAMDAWYADGQLTVEHRAETRTANPYLDWLLREAWAEEEPAKLVKALAKQLLAADVPLLRFSLLVRTLHPQMFAVSYEWWRDQSVVRETQRSHDILLKSEYLDSPYAPILQGAGGVRRRLEGPNPRLDFPVLMELRERGATDYAAMPLMFSDGQINIITLVSDRPGGFSTSELGRIYEVLPLLSRLFEVHALKRTSQVLLATYLGRYTGPRVLNGLIKRGDGEDIHAVVWFSDLRGSTSLTESMPRMSYLELLNDFFDSMAGAVIDYGGEVLKYVGDAVVAIFPIDNPADTHPHAVQRALEAAREARTRMEVVNRRRKSVGASAVGYGIALHRGEFTYGNIGTTGRLDFTVIGAAANEASRIEGMCKQLGKYIVLSEAFKTSYQLPLVSLGHHKLRGVEAVQELFTIPD